MWLSLPTAIAAVLLLMTFIFAGGAPVIAVPLALFILVGGWLLRRQGRQQREVGGLREKVPQAGQDSGEIEFTDRDQETLHSP